MREIKILTVLFAISFAGTVISFGGGVYSLVKEKQVRQEKTLPETQIAIPALSQ
jgi:hypothetical protein